MLTKSIKRAYFSCSFKVVVKGELGVQSVLTISSSDPIVKMPVDLKQEISD